MSKVIIEQPKLSVNAVLDRLQRGDYLKKGKLPEFHLDFKRIDSEIGEQKALSTDLSNVKFPKGSHIQDSTWMSLIVVQMLRAGQKELAMATDREYEKKLALSLMRTQR